MTAQPASLYNAAYRLDRRDRAAFERATGGDGPMLAAVLGTLVWFAALALLPLLTGGTDALAHLVSSIATGRAPSLTYALVFGPPMLLALLPAARRGAMTLANDRLASARDIHVAITPSGLETAVGDAPSRLAWEAVTRLVETPAHLFVLAADGEAVIVPRRALASETDFDNLVGFIRARTGLATS